jgi:hypothetical protein
VYRFTPDAQATRLFVYGFDLGRQGVLLYRTQADPPPQDAAPPLPPVPRLPPSRTGPDSAPSEPHHPPR